MRFGIVILPEHRWAHAAPMWQRAERLGFDHAWTYDHLTWKGLPDAPWFGTTPTLTAAALATSSIRLGTFVTSPNFRHPLTLSRDILALDDISGGRFACGIGAGGTLDSTILGGEPLPPRATVDRLTEFVELLDRLLTTDHVDHSGTWFTTRDARTLPGCVQQPRVPFVVAANGPRTQRLAVRYGSAWLTTGGADRDDEDTWFATLATLAARMDDLLAAAGRDPATLERHIALDVIGYAMSSVGRFTDLTGRAAELGFTDVIVHHPRPDGVFAGKLDDLEEIAATVIPQLPMR